MATIIFEKTIPIIPNTQMEKGFIDGIHKIYRITPNEGYALHNKARDWVEKDPIIEEETYYMAYSTTSSSCGSDYDFSPVIIQDEAGNDFTVYGAKFQFATKPVCDIPPKQLFGII